jgi:alpha-beta hydrolase superfamily lysophospholipase
LGTVLLSHGFGEHRLRYSHVIEAWLKRGLLVLAYDLRGHGASAGPRGHVERFSDYVDDASALLDELERLPGASAVAPSVVFGHSFGALISIHVALRNPARVRLLALSSPFLGLAMQVPALKLALGRALSRYVPRFSMPNGISPTILTHDLSIVRRTASDPLCERMVSARWFTETAAAQEAAFARAAELCVPIFCLYAGDDRLALASASHAFSLRVGSEHKLFRELPGQYHEILNELERQSTIDEYAAAMLAAFAPSAARQAEAR